MTAPTAGRYVLDLRLDVDERYANSPVLNRVSADRYELNVLRSPGRPDKNWRVYQESWVCDTPVVDWQERQVVVTGALHYWRGSHSATTLEIIVPRTPAVVGPAGVTLREAGGVEATFSCAQQSDCFRAVDLEIDVCQSVNRAPVIPGYDTDAHGTRPADLSRRRLTIEEVYREAGVAVTITGTPEVIDDRAPGFKTWSPAELHDAMEQHFSQYTGTWPKWQMWGLLAGAYDNGDVGGLMFDGGGASGGAGLPPERQGFAVFRKHGWFDALPAAEPTTQDEAAAARKYLYTWVHEAGHAYNLLHSWGKNRPDALSWMNYDWRYDQRNGTDSFWASFQLRFDDEELMHLRHGDRGAVMMGGDAWGSRSHLESPVGANALVEGEVPLELLLRSKEYFEFMEPVYLELRLRNLLPDAPVDIDARLAPEFGTVLVHIRRPDGRIIEYAPILWHLGDPNPKTLEPASSAKGLERHSEEFPVTYGGYGFHFDQPGQYFVRATYQGAGDLVVMSNVHRLRIGVPKTRDEDRIAQDFFSYEVGMSLYLRDTRSRSLAKGKATLELISERFGDTLVGAKVATEMAMSEARPFYQLKGHRLEVGSAPDPTRALELSGQAVAVYRQHPEKALNLGYTKAVERHAQLLSEHGQSAEARQEVQVLCADLEKRGANAPVLEQLNAFAETVGSGPVQADA